MKKAMVVVAALVGVAGVAGIAGTAAGLFGDELPANLAHLTVGQPAPDFRLTDANGRPVRLADYRGRTVVLEWNNPECPFVQKHYGSGNMQRTQAAAMQDGVAWLTINSNAAGKQGHMDGAGANAFLAETGARPSAYLLDSAGQVGRAYGARTTPHMYVIDGAGTLVYAGGIDDRPTSDQDDIPGARNHVLAALADLEAARPVSVATAQPYGCSVKYASG